MNCWRELRLRPETRGSAKSSPTGNNKTYLLPGLNLSICVDIRSVGICPSRWMDDGSLCYQKRTRGRRALCVIVHTELGVNVVLGRSRPGERSKDDTMGEGRSTDLDRSEESRSLGKRRHHSRV